MYNNRVSLHRNVPHKPTTAPDSQRDGRSDRVVESALHHGAESKNRLFIRVVRAYVSLIELAHRTFVVFLFLLFSR